jgi:hypothetical protein
MAHLEDESSPQQILEAAYGVTSKPATGENPVVLSCGGIFIPQPRHPSIQYHILNTTTDASTAKVVSGILPHNMLHLVMAKESMN